MDHAEPPTCGECEAILSDIFLCAWCGDRFCHEHVQQVGGDDDEEAVLCCNRHLKHFAKRTAEPSSDALSVFHGGADAPDHCALKPQPNELAVLDLNDARDDWILRVNWKHEELSKFARESNERASCSTAADGAGSSAHFVVAEDEFSSASPTRSPSNEYTPVVSMFGATHAGKSTMISALCGDSDSNPAVAEGHSMDPTTANVTTHTSHVCDLRVRFLDFEGLNAGDKLPSNIKRLMGDVEDTTLLARRRRCMVNKYLPKLSYLLSDVVIYVSLEPWVSDVHVRTLRDHCTIASSSIRSAGKPFLLLIHNRVHPGSTSEEWERIRSISTTTKLFKSQNQLESPGTDDEATPSFSSLFSDVLCVNIPDRDWGAQYFEQQIADVRKVLSHLLRKRLSTREDTGTSFSNAVWYYLCTRLIEQMYIEPVIDMGQLLGEYLMPREAVQHTCCVYFAQLYDNIMFQVDGRSKSFLFCRQATIHCCAVLFARVLLDRVRREVDGDMDSARSVLEKIVPTAHWSRVIKNVLDHVDCRAPCSSVHPANPGIECEQSQRGHECHRSAMRVKVVMENDRVVVKILKSILGVAFTPTWDGEFEPAYEALPDQDDAVFSAMVKSYGMQMLDEGEMEAKERLFESLVAPNVCLRSSLSPTTRIVGSICLRCWSELSDALETDDTIINPPPLEGAQKRVKRSATCCGHFCVACMGSKFNGRCPMRHSTGTSTSHRARKSLSATTAYQFS